MAERVKRAFIKGKNQSRKIDDEEIFYNNQLKPKPPVKEKSKKALIIVK